MRQPRRQSRIKEVQIKSKEKPATNITSTTKTEDKLKTNRGQSRDKVETKPRTKWRQTEDKPRTKNSQFRETEDKVGTKPETSTDLKWRQTEDKVETNLSFSSLVGLQAKLAKIIFTQCRNNASLETDPLTLSFLSEITGNPTNSIKKTLQRLEKKGIIERKSFKNGRGGWSIYVINKNIYYELLNIKTEDKVETNRGQSGDKVGTKVGTKPETSLPSSSSSILNTTTEDQKYSAMHNEIQTPDILKNLGFGKSHLAQIQNRFSFTPKEVLGFLEAFAFDLENGERERLKGRGINPIGYFFGALKNGGYNPVNEGFKTSEELAEEEMIARLEKKQREREVKNKKLEELLFEEWLESKSKEDLLKIEEPLHGYLDMFHKSALKEYFVLSEMEIFKNNHI